MLVVQILFAAAAVSLIWFLWKAVAVHDARIGRVVAAGLLIRAFAGQAAFWISYLRLPIRPDLQAGDGFWFYALDGIVYFRSAQHLARSGFYAILSVDKLEPSIVYVQILSIFVVLFGAAASTGILLNLLSYLGTCYCIARWGKDQAGVSQGGLISIVALSLSPSAILWATQPLKDTFFFFAVVLFFFAFWTWQMLWQSGAPSNSDGALRWIVTVFLIAVATYMLAGTRAYFAVVAVLMSVAVLPLAVVTLPRRRVRFAISSLVLLFFLSQVVRFIAEPYLPPFVERALSFRSRSAESLPGDLVKTANQMREGFQRTGGNTTIEAGEALVVAEFDAETELKEWPPVAAHRGMRDVPTTAARGNPAPEGVVIQRLRARKLLVGFSALVLPCSIAERLGLIKVGGGRGLWAFVELDTVVFDVLLTVVVLAFVRAARARTMLNPLPWQILGTTAILAILLVYTVTNFGTLFRHRLMIFSSLALIPVAVSAAMISKRHENDQVTAETGAAGITGATILEAFTMKRRHGKRPGSRRRTRPLVIRVIARMNVGGPAKHVVWLNAGMRDFDSILVSGSVPRGEQEMTSFAALRRIRRLRVAAMSREIGLNDLLVIVRLYRIFRRLRPDVVHTHTAKAGTVGRIAALLYKWTARHPCVVVHTFHGHIFHHYYGRLKTTLFLLIEKILARIVTDRIVVISPQQYHEICEVYGVGRPEQYRIVPLGIELERFGRPDHAAPGGTPGVAGEDARSPYNRFRDEFAVLQNEVAVGIVGRLTEVKNHALLLRSAAALALRNPELGKRSRFFIIGEGHLRSTLEELADHLEVRRVTFTGLREDPEVFYGGLDLLALTSLNEGTPLTILEAMASGVPVVATAVGGVVDLLGPETEEHGGFVICERGLLVRGNDATAFAAALEFAMSNPARMKGLARRAAEYVRLHHSTEHLISNMAALYKELLAGTASHSASRVSGSTMPAHSNGEMP